MGRRLLGNGLTVGVRQGFISKEILRASEPSWSYHGRSEASSSAYSWELELILCPNSPWRAVPFTVVCWPFFIHANLRSPQLATLRANHVRHNIQMGTSRCFILFVMWQRTINLGHYFVILVLELVISICQRSCLLLVLTKHILDEDSPVADASNSLVFKAIDFHVINI